MTTDKPAEPDMLYLLQYFIADHTLNYYWCSLSKHFGCSYSYSIFCFITVSCQNLRI